jgi:hypothetical protein
MTVNDQFQLLSRSLASQKQRTKSREDSAQDRRDGLWFSDAELAPGARKASDLLKAGWAERGAWPIASSKLGRPTLGQEIVHGNNTWRAGHVLHQESRSRADDLRRQASPDRAERCCSFFLTTPSIGLSVAIGSGTWLDLLFFCLFKPGRIGSGTWLDLVLGLDL